MKGPSLIMQKVFVQNNLGTVTNSRKVFVAAFIL